MEVVVVPNADAAGHALVLAALNAVGAEFQELAGPQSAWLKAALAEGVDRGVVPAGYGLSPRSNRGAARA
jgi:hypothetical protein